MELSKTTEMNTYLIKVYFQSNPNAMNEAKIVDFYSIKSFHEMFNISFVLMCSEIFSQVEVLLGKTAYENLLLLCHNNKISMPENVSIRVKFVCEKESQWGAFIRTLIGGFRVLKEYLFLSANTTFVLNYSNVFAFPFLLIINRFLKKKVLITFHGDLELLAASPISKGKPSFWYACIYRWSFLRLLPKSNSKILVLGSSIRENLLKLYPRTKHSIISINHPYIFPQNSECLNTKLKRTDVLTLGVLGRLDAKKGLHQLLYLAKHFEKQVVIGRLVLKSIGGKPHGINNDDWKCIEWGTEQAMSRSDFEKQISTVDYILCLYPVDSYKITASGIAMDALRFLKPIIGLRNNYLKALTEKYKVGFVVDSVDEIIEIINKELSDKTLPTQFESELFRMRNIFKVSYNAQLLKAALDNA